MIERNPVEALGQAQATLEALTRWWIDKPSGHEFMRGEFPRAFPKAIDNADLGGRPQADHRQRPTSDEDRGSAEVSECY